MRGSLVAAVAETRDLSVLRCDADFELTPDVTAVSRRWIARRVPRTDLAAAARLASMAPSAPEPSSTGRVRREPPAFRRVEVRRSEHVSPRMVRVTLTGRELAGLAVDEPAASVRVLLPSSGADELVIPTWDRNDFRLADGSRATIRTFTPRRVDPEALELDVDVVVHGGGVASRWAAGASAGDPAAVSGPGRGYAIDHGAPAFLLAGDETAIPAISQLLTVLPIDTPVQVHIEIVAADARLPLPDRPGTSVGWCELPGGAAPGAALVAAVRGAEILPETRIWVAGEAAAVQRIRRHLFDERRVPRSQTTVRGYWKHGRAGDAESV